MHKKRLLVIFYIITINIISSGCDINYNVPEGYYEKPHTREQALTYLQEYLNDTNVTISDNYTDTSDEYNFKMRVWEANYNGTSFHIASKQTLVWDKYGEFAKAYYALTTDFYYTVTNDLINLYTGDKNLVSIGSIDYRERVYIHVNLQDRNSLDNAFTQAENIHDYIISYYPSIYLLFAFDSIDYLSNENITIEYVKTFDEAAYESILGKYCVYRNTYLNADEFTKEEIEKYIEKYSRKFTVIKGETTYSFDDLNLLPIQYENISYETMYEVLIRCGFEVNGDKSSFSFTGTNNNVFSFSRSFVDKKNVYYYLKNGTRVNMKLTYGYNNFIDNTTFEKLTGMQIKEHEYVHVQN